MGAAFIAGGELRADGRVREHHDTEIKKALAKEAMSGRTSTDLTLRYQKADHSWHEAQQVWDEYTTTQRDLKAKRALLALAKDQKEKIKQATTTIDPQTTLLGRIATLTGKAAAPLSYIPTPGIPLGGIASGISMVAKELNEIWIKKDLWAAQRALMLAEKDFEKTQSLADAVWNKPARYNKNAQKAEGTAAALEVEATKKTAERLKQLLKPPLRALDGTLEEADWNRWAEKIVNSAGWSSSLMTIHLRNIARAEARLAADQAAWRDIWPEHNIVADPLYSLPSLLSLEDESTSLEENLADRYLDLAEGLERTLHRPVDLVTEASVRNPIFRKVVEQSKILIYDAPVTKIPH